MNTSLGHHESKARSQLSHSVVGAQRTAGLHLTHSGTGARRSNPAGHQRPHFTATAPSAVCALAMERSLEGSVIRSLVTREGEITESGERLGRDGH